jgi:hypothetical protein
MLGASFAHAYPIDWSFRRTFESKTIFKSQSHPSINNSFFNNNRYVTKIQNCSRFMRVDQFLVV